MVASQPLPNSSSSSDFTSAATADNSAHGSHIDGAVAAKQGFSTAWETALTQVFGEARGAELNVESIRIERSYAGASGVVAATAVLTLAPSRLQEHEIDEFVAVLFETSGASTAVAGATREGTTHAYGNALWSCMQT